MKHSRRRFTPLLCVLFGHRYGAWRRMRVDAGDSGYSTYARMRCTRCGAMRRWSE